ncbi:N-acetylmuramoyl-L-alanine amidase [Bradyrhizobium sp.]|uniref:N-acetylmuramoyl-L-alanine amidase n=1 Tax=Bradyrhizobium sp. TaxID=376 RepID=UPI0025BE27C8|nr:N-acetylmuramoyl-L-alanine amidase [Bradyrhizobium sp.]MCA3256163.1 N-acetylmuramoyl-L-alanine amidase [Alphaproteobacteria bacterium]MCA3571145.1 N-acetylmuramoyl-L-alanine amidase [Bradyrhizobium sp.]
MIEATEIPSPNFDERNGTPVTILVLHYTGMPTGEGALKTLTTPESKVSSHYLVMEDGAILRLVPEEKRAWHAGRSWWRGRRDVNADSVGIEIVNPGHEWGYRPFPDVQMASVLRLVKDIVERHGIKPIDVVGHSDIAPTRKEDPGELFDWALLARHGLALGPVKALADPHWTDAGTLMALERFGYDVTDGVAAIRAFQRHFRPSRVDGVIDGETRAVLLRLLIDNGQPEVDDA